MMPENGLEWLGIFAFIGSALVCLWAYRYNRKHLNGNGVRVHWL